MPRKNVWEKKKVLLKEYPLAQKELKRKGNFWILDADICNYAGACRFYVGLADEIKVIDSPEFEEYVRGYVQKNLLKKPEFKHETQSVRRI